MFKRVTMLAGYHTAGLLLHEPCVAVEQLAALGYGCVAIRPHRATLDPAMPGFDTHWQRLGGVIAETGVAAVLDLDAPFYHDPWRRLGPSLASDEVPEREAATAWVRQWVEHAGTIGCSLVTFASGRASDRQSDESQLESLAIELERLSKVASPHRVQLALRPRSGDAIATVAHFERLQQWLPPAVSLMLAADVGEMLWGGELPVVDRLVRNQASLACVYLCQREAGELGDRRVGHGDVALARIVRSLGRHHFAGPAIVRIEGHSELGFTPAQEAIQIFEDAVQ